MVPPKNAFSRKTATTYALVHRPQTDPSIHDPEAPTQIFTAISGPSDATNSFQGPQSQAPNPKIKQRQDLDPEFGASGAVRENEGEAAEHGVFYDDTKYDYMQHMRDLGQGGGDAAWVDAAVKSDGKKKGKGKQRLEDALRDVEIGGSEAGDSASLGGLSAYTKNSDIIQFSGAPKRSIYEQQQDLPDALRGFRPDMDPRLREVMEALEDEAYVDDEEALFEELAGEGGEEVDMDEWEAGGLYLDDDDGWQSDHTTKPLREYPTYPDADAAMQHMPLDSLPDPHEAPPDAEPIELPTKTTSSSTTTPKFQTPSIAPSAAYTADTSLTTGRRKKRKGALTSSAGMSMTSSALARTEPLSTLDSRFDRVLDSYMDDIDEEGDDFADDSMSAVSGMTGVSRMTGMSKGSRAASRASMTSKSALSAAGSDFGSEAPSLVSNAGLNSVMDEFLGTTGGDKKGRKMRKAGREGVWGQQGGMEQLDEIRKGLGPARTKAGNSGVKV